MGDRLSVRNPRTGLIDHWITPADRADLDRQSQTLRQAQTGWAEQGLTRRIESLQQWKEALISERGELLQALMTDTGRRSESVIEFDVLVSSIDRWCRLAPELLMSPGERTTSIPFIRIRSDLVPYALVGVISPWNFPLLLSHIDTIPALLAGCAVLVKPSEVTPRFIQPLSQIVSRIPGLRDVIGYVEGAGQTGAELVESVDAICFTGSIETGRLVATMAARRFIPAFLELGGKDPAIVLESADLEIATSAILWGAVVNAGQSCLSIERVYVAASRVEEFVNLIVRKARRLRLAYPTYEDGQIGPIIDEAQAKIIDSHMRDAVERGAMIHCGGPVENLGGGLWCRPTVLTRVNHSMKVMREETFGPLIPIMPFSSVEEAIDLANDTIYGLSAAVFAGSTDEAEAIARHLEAGGISINDAALTSMVHEGEKNSFKLSGLGGSRMGPGAIKRFVRQKAIIRKTESVADPWWYDTGN